MKDAGLMTGVHSGKNKTKMYATEELMNERLIREGCNGDDRMMWILRDVVQMEG